MLASACGGQGRTKEGLSLAAEILAAQTALVNQSRAMSQLAVQLETLSVKAEMLSPTIVEPDSDLLPQVSAKSLTSEDEGRAICPPRTLTFSALSARTLPVGDGSEIDTNESLRLEEINRGQFKDGEELQAWMNAMMWRRSYNVRHFYRTSGLCQKIARSHAFETASLVVVVLSSLWMAVDADHNRAGLLHQADTQYRVMSNLFCFLFTVEVTIRFLAFERIRNVVKDVWFVFDLVLLVFTILETWVLWCLIEGFALDASAMGNGVFRVFRMLRMVRVLRLAAALHLLPELFVIVRGIGIAFRAISVVFALLGIFIFICAIALRLLLEGSNIGNLRFKTVPQAMATLLLDCAMSGTRGGPLIREAYSESIISSGFLFCTSLLTNVCLMGMMSALLVQTVKKIAESEEEEKSLIRSLVLMDDFWNHVASMDESNDGYITIEGLFEILSSEKTVRLLHKMSVDPEALINLSEFVFSEHGNRLSRLEFNRFVLDLRTSQKGTLQDHLVTRRFLKAKLTQLFQDLDRQPDTGLPVTPAASISV